jgi:hypothetical protein
MTFAPLHKNSVYRRLGRLISCLTMLTLINKLEVLQYGNKSTTNGTKYARQIFKEAMILTFD